MRIYSLGYSPEAKTKLYNLRENNRENNRSNKKRKVSFSHILKVKVPLVIQPLASAESRGLTKSVCTLVSDPDVCLAVVRHELSDTRTNSDRMPSHNLELVLPNNHETECAPNTSLYPIVVYCSSSVHVTLSLRTTLSLSNQTSTAVNGSAEPHRHKIPSAAAQCGGFQTRIRLRRRTSLCRSDPRNR